MNRSPADDSPGPADDSPGAADQFDLPQGVVIGQAVPTQAAAIVELMKPFVKQGLLLSRSEAEVIELTRHGFVASLDDEVIGFSAVEVYSAKLAELQCLAVSQRFQSSGIGRVLVDQCVRRAHSLNVMEVLAISASEKFLQACGFDYSLPGQKKALFFQLRPRNSEQSTSVDTGSGSS